MAPKPLFAGRVSAYPLTVLIVGGGTAGHAVAFAIQRAGHTAVILDRNPPGFVEKGAGRHIPPNAVKILDELGLGDEMRRWAFVSEGVDFMHHNTEKLIGHNPFHPSLVQDSGAPFLLTDHSEAQNLLHILSKQSGATVMYNSLVVGLDPDTNTVQLENGKTMSADLIVGADGPYSIVRRSCFGLGGVGKEVKKVGDGEENNCDSESKAKRPMMCSVALLDARIMRNDPYLEPLTRTRFNTLWMGHERVVWGHPVRNRTGYALELHYPRPQHLHNDYGSNQSNGTTPSDPQKARKAALEETLREMKNHWKEGELSDEVRDGFKDFGVKFQRVLKMVKTVHTSIRLDLNPLECFNYPPCGHPQNPSDEESADELTVVLGGNQTLPKSNVVLVGDSAHPLVPDAVNAFGLAVEDALVLGSLLSRYDPSSPRQTLRALLNAYSAIRVDRATLNVEGERHKIEWLTWDPSSPAAKERDRKFKITTEEGKFEGEVMEQVGSMWAYHAGDEAEDWWVKWRMPKERSEAARSGRLRAISRVSRDAFGEIVDDGSPADGKADVIGWDTRCEVDIVQKVRSDDDPPSSDEDDEDEDEDAAVEN